MDLTFKKPERKGMPMASKEPSEETETPEEATARTPDELGSALKEAMDAGDGMAICEAVKSIMSEYKE